MDRSGTIAKIRIGAVSYLNSKPLIYGLERHPGVALHLRVPADLLAGLVNASFDVALLPVIDLQRMENLELIPVGGIGCDGPTLTVCIFHNEPIERITALACDVESHTSVALARVVLAERYGIFPKLIALEKGAAPPDAARLMIGDKVVASAPADLPFHIDLGSQWKQMTGLPFLFAGWVCRAGFPRDGELQTLLAEALRHGLADIDGIVAEFAGPRRWPPALARQYLSEYLKYEVGPRQIAAVKLFHALAAKHGAIDHAPWPLRVRAME